MAEWHSHAYPYHPPIPMQGKTYGHWTVGAESRQRRGRAHWVCTCTCGASLVLSGNEIRAMDRRGLRPCRRCGTGGEVTREGSG